MVNRPQSNSEADSLHLAGRDTAFDTPNTAAGISKSRAAKAYASLDFNRREVDRDTGPRMGLDQLHVDNWTVVGVVICPETWAFIWKPWKTRFEDRNYNQTATKRHAW